MEKSVLASLTMNQEGAPPMSPLSRSLGDMAHHLHDGGGAKSMPAGRGNPFRTPG